MLHSLHQSFALALYTALAFASGLLALILQGATGYQSFWQMPVTVLLSIMGGVGAVVAKEWYDRRSRVTEREIAAHATDSTSAVEMEKVTVTNLLERERLVNLRSGELLEELKAYYSVRDKEKEGVIGLLKELVAHQESVINAQKDVLAHQAALLVPKST